METHLGWRVVRRAWLAHPEKFELDMVYPYAWSVRPSGSLDPAQLFVIRSRTKDDPARAIFEQLEAQGLVRQRGRSTSARTRRTGKNVDARSRSPTAHIVEAICSADVLVDMGLAPGDMVVIDMSTDIKGRAASAATWSGRRTTSRSGPGRHLQRRSSRTWVRR